MKGEEKKKDGSLFFLTVLLLVSVFVIKPGRDFFKITISKTLFKNLLVCEIQPVTLQILFWKLMNNPSTEHFLIEGAFKKLCSVL